MFKKVLIANRGEIALRVIRTAREMGIRTAAVYSDIDRTACHVLAADEAYFIGPAAPLASYLRIEGIIEAALRAKADCLHPGYGFLSENPSLARACADNGIIFIGPSEYAMNTMGSKILSRKAMQDAGVPVVPGTVQPLQDAVEAASVAAAVGYPVLLKASAGGGGKGMRMVSAPDEMGSAFRQASSEGQRAFGDGTLYVEKVIARPRHIEIQILGDGTHAMHYGERECSVQRRHQKVVEECPSPLMTPELREKMGSAATRAAEAVGYRGAGTVEFLVDAKGNFYFLEMNTRIQVEHPVTEMVTGVDLVQEQFRIAAGQPLPGTLDAGQMRGWALECRIYAENPFNNFAPSPGTIRDLRIPHGPGIRADMGVMAGSRVPAEYDPMIGKITAWAPSREAVIARMARALGECRILGIASNLALHKRILENTEFLSGHYDTGLIERHADSLLSYASRHEHEAVAAAAIMKYRQRAKRPVPPSSTSASGMWLSDGRRRALRKV